MLYKNGKPFKMPENAVHNILKELGLEFPISIKYTKNLIRRDEVNQVDIYPAGVHIRPSANVFSESGVDTFRYATKVRQNKKGQEVFLPASIQVNKVLMLHKKDAEFFYWLYNYSTLIANGVNPSPNAPLEIELKERESAATNRIRAIRAKVEAAILSEDADLDMLKNIAYAYYIPNVEGMGVEELKSSIVNLASVKNKTEEYERLLEMIQGNLSIEGKALISKAFEEGKLIINEKSRTYHWGLDGEKGDVIMKGVGAKLSPRDFYDQLSRNKTKYIEVLSQLKEL
jgi:hypothetical protein